MAKCSWVGEAHGTGREAGPVLAAVDFAVSVAAALALVPVAAAAAVAVAANAAAGAGPAVSEAAAMASVLDWGEKSNPQGLSHS